MKKVLKERLTALINGEDSIGEFYDWVMDRCWEDQSDPPYDIPTDILHEMFLHLCERDYGHRTDQEIIEMASESLRRLKDQEENDE